MLCSLTQVIKLYYLVEVVAVKTKKIKEFGVFLIEAPCVPAFSIGRWAHISDGGREN